MNKKKLGEAVVITLALVLTIGAFSLAVAKSEKSNGNASQNNGSDNKLENELKKTEKNNTTNSQIYKAKNGLVVKNLQEIADKEKNNSQAQNTEQEQNKNAGNTGNQEQEQNEQQAQIAEDLEGIAEEEEAAEEDVTGSIEEVEKRGKLKTLLVGTDYKNLGQLRSELVRNRNQIRKLTQLVNKVEGGENQQAIQNQIATLLQQREGIYNLIKTNEEKFSVLGWVFRFLSGYPSEPITDQEGEEGDLIEEIEDTIDETDDGDATESEEADDTNDTSDTEDADEGEAGGTQTETTQE